MYFDDATREERKEHEKRKQWYRKQLGSRLREWNKKNTEYYGGDYYKVDPIFFLTISSASLFSPDDPEKELSNSEGS